MMECDRKAVQATIANVIQVKFSSAKEVIESAFPSYNEERACQFIPNRFLEALVRCHVVSLAELE